MINDNKKPKLNPILDPVFQTLFSNERKYNLEHLVSYILHQNIHIIKIENEYSLQRSRPDEKISRLDLLAVDENNSTFIIELQLENQHNMGERLKYSNCSKIVKQLKRGDWYKDLKPVITIALLDFELDELKGFNVFCAEASTIFSGITPEVRLTNLQRYYIIHLSKARELYEKGSTDPLVKWCMFLKEPNSLEVQEIMNKDNEIKKLNDDLEEISQDEKLIDEAEFWRMNSIYLDWDKKSYAKFQVKERNIEIAKNMLKENFDINLIIKLTGLSKEEIENLKE